MAAVPVNRRMWNMFILQAKRKYRVYPSPAASHWVHQQYVQHGGRFVEDGGSRGKDRDHR